MDKQYYVYILTNKYNSVFYIGITNNLIRRIYEHKNKLVEGFTKKYNINKLVYYEISNSVESAILRDLHCFDIKISYLSKSNTLGRYREFWITLRLKAMYDQDISLYKNNRDYKKWYDWDFKNA